MSNDEAGSLGKFILLEIFFFFFWSGVVRLYPDEPKPNRFKKMPHFKGNHVDFNIGLGTTILQGINLLDQHLLGSKSICFYYLDLIMTITSRL